jgi:hypothetical protein
MNWRKPTALGVLALILFASCKKSNNNAPDLLSPRPPAPSGPFLYVGSWSGTQPASYWKISLSSTAPDLSPKLLNDATQITSIVTSGADVYMAGSSADNSGIYWHNGLPVAVSNAAQILYLAVAGGNVYGAGFDRPGNIAYWTNGIETDLNGTLPTGVGYSFLPSGISVSGNNVYISGSISYTLSPGNLGYYGETAIYWANSALVNLYQHGYGGAVYPATTGVAASGNDVYVAGNMDINADTMAWCGYWKNNTKVDLLFRSGGTYASSTGIAVSGSDVYVIGNYISPSGGSAVYWKNGNLNTLPGGGAATAISTFGSDVYIVGSDADGAHFDIWKNGQLWQSLSRGNSISPTCLAIGD